MLIIRLETGTESFILIAWKLQILGQKNLWGIYLTPLDIESLLWKLRNVPYMTIVDKDFNALCF